MDIADLEQIKECRYHALQTTRPLPMAQSRTGGAGAPAKASPVPLDLGSFREERSSAMSARLRDVCHGWACALPPCLPGAFRRTVPCEPIPRTQKLLPAGGTRQFEVALPVRIAPAAKSNSIALTTADHRAIDSPRVGCFSARRAEAMARLTPCRMVWPTRVDSAPKRAEFATAPKDSAASRTDFLGQRSPMGIARIHPRLAKTRPGAKPSTPPPTTSPRKESFAPAAAIGDDNNPAKPTHSDNVCPRCHKAFLRFHFPTRRWYCANPYCNWTDRP